MDGTPFGDLEELFERLGDQFEGGQRGFGMRSGIRVDVLDDDEEYVVTADLPGYDTEDVELTLANQTLTIEATRERETARPETRFLRRERRHGTSSTRVQLPETVDEEGVEAAFSNGVLTVTLPKEIADARRIDIE